MYMHFILALAARWNGIGLQMAPHGCDVFVPKSRRAIAASSLHSDTRLSSRGGKHTFETTLKCMCTPVHLQ